VNNRLLMTSGALQIEIGIRASGGTVVSLNSEGNAVIGTNSQIEYSMSGARPDTIFEVWLFSEPMKLATIVVGEDGTASGSITVKSKVSSGSHRLVMTAQSSAGEKATISVGVIAGEQGNGVPISRIIFGILVLAVVAGLVIPATRRLRRDPLRA
jgi:hypothetical protein